MNRGPKLRFVLLCATDAGGLKNLVPIAEHLSHAEIPFSFVTNDLYFAYLNDLALKKGEILKGSSYESPIAAAHLLKQKNPDLVICGTTRYLSPDRLFTKAAREKGIRSIVVLDEWYNYRWRFENENGELEYLPDLIAAMDETAVSEAMAEGIPRDILRAAGNPFLTRLHDSIESFHVKPPPRPHFLTNPRGKVVTYLSDELKANFGETTGRPREKMGEHPGFDEETVKQDLLEVLASTNEEIFFVEKLHPSSTRKNSADEYSDKILVTTVRDIDLATLLWHSDLVVGITTMALLESALLQKSAVSYQPKSASRLSCTAVKLGLVPLVRTKEELKSWFSENWDSPRAKTRSSGFSFINKDVVKNILELK